MHRRWSLVAGFSHTWVREHARGYFGQVVRANVYPLTPNDLIEHGRRRTTRVPDLVRAGIRHLRRAVRAAHHAVPASPVRPALRPHVQRANRSAEHRIAHGPRRADRHAPDGPRHAVRHARGEGVRAGRGPPSVSLHRRLQPAQREPGAEHQLDVGNGVPGSRSPSCRRGSRGSARSSTGDSSAPAATSE